MAITSRRENLLKFSGEELQYKFMTEMDFEEYLWARGEKELADLIRKTYQNRKACSKHAKIMDLFYDYLLTGGFPEVVKESFQSISRGYYESVKEKVAEVKAAAADPEVYVQYQGNESNLAVITERIKKQYVEEGHKESDIKSLKIYLKPEDASAYYVINDNNSGKVFLF